MRHPRRDAACNTSEVEDMMANLGNFLLLFGPVGPYPVGMVMICRTNRIGDGLLQYQGGNLPPCLQACASLIGVGWRVQENW